MLNLFVIKLCMIFPLQLEPTKHRLLAHVLFHSPLLFQLFYLFFFLVNGNWLGRFSWWMPCSRWCSGMAKFRRRRIVRIAWVKQDGSGSRQTETHNLFVLLCTLYLLRKCKCAGWPAALPNRCEILAAEIACAPACPRHLPESRKFLVRRD